MTIMAEFDPNREKNINILQQAEKMTSLLLSQKKGLITADNVKIGLQCILRKDWPEEEYGRLMSFHPPEGLYGTIISYCDGSNTNYGQADPKAPWLNREYLVNGRLSESHTVIVKWNKFTEQAMHLLDKVKEGLCEQQGTYRIGHQGQYWLELYEYNPEPTKAMT